MLRTLAILLGDFLFKAAAFCVCIFGTILLGAVFLTPEHFWTALFLFLVWWPFLAVGWFLMRFEEAVVDDRVDEFT